MNATRNAGVTSGALVTLVAAAASYTHMRELAARHGEAWLSWLMPLSVDGLMVVASLVIIVSRRTVGRSGLAWLALVVGVLVSLLANVAAAGPDLVSRLIAAWPPLAFATAFELVLRLVRATRPGPVDDEPTDHANRSGPHGYQYGPEPTEEPTATAERTDDELLELLRTLAEQHGGTPSLTAVRTGLRVGTGRARRLLSQFDGVPSIR